MMRILLIQAHHQNVTMLIQTQATNILMLHPTLQLYL